MGKCSIATERIVHMLPCGQVWLLVKLQIRLPQITADGITINLQALGDVSVLLLLKPCSVEKEKMCMEWGGI